MADEAARIAALEELVAKLTTITLEMRKELNFTSIVARQAMFTLARLVGRLDKTGIIASAEENGLAAVTHALLLKHEQNPLFSEDDRASAKLWREQLGRDA